MKIKILGTRGKVELSKPWHSKHSGVLIDGSLLIDLGEKEFLDHDPEVLFITHLHPDHAFFVENKQILTLDIPVYAPESSEYLENAGIISGEVQWKDYTLIPVPVIHSLKVKCLAYLVRKQDTKILYTGDTAWIEKKYHHIFGMFGALDLVITDASTIRKDGLIRRDKKSERIFGHAGVPGLVNMFSEYSRHIVFTHYGSWFLKDVPAGRKMIESFGKKGLTVDAAHDGKEYEVNV